MSALAAAVERRLRDWTSEQVAERLWARDGTLWAASGAEPSEIARWLGWLDLPEASRSRIPELAHLARHVAQDGYRRSAVLGMGGSSLAPELFARTFPTDGLELRVLDSTHPDAVRGFREWAASARTLFCVSSKSGTTTEPLAFHAAMAAQAPALDFVAITDPGTPLAELARAQEFRAIIEAPPDVGGRYSALSVFGLVPAALHGVDLPRLLDGAVAMADVCHRAADRNPGLRLGAWMAEAALAGRDKLTLVADDDLASFGDWAEQLIAESTGKAGRGIVPVVGERPAAPEAYGDDRAFVLLRTAGDASRDWPALATALAAAGHPIFEIELGDRYDVGAEFIRWEIATAAAGIALAINPFDQPNVQEAKDATRALLHEFRRTGALPAPAPLVGEPGMIATADPTTLGDVPVTVDGAVRALLESARPGDYVALLAYLPPDPDVAAMLAEMRLTVRDGLGVATTLGFGPRYLHSTGQLHKGGPPSGIFLQLTAEPRRDLPIPGWQESFGTLIAAQALGDLTALQRRGRRVLRLHLADAETGLERVAAMVAAALPAPAGTATQR